MLDHFKCRSDDETTWGLTCYDILCKRYLFQIQFTTTSHPKPKKTYCVNVLRSIWEKARQHFMLQQQNSTSEQENFSESCRHDQILSPQYVAQIHTGLILCDLSWR